jgi:hypothetical protein
LTWFHLGFRQNVMLQLPAQAAQHSSKNTGHCCSGNLHAYVELAHADRFLASTQHSHRLLSASVRFLLT